MRGLIRRVGSGERGFTLIELLVVIAILGIIAAVVVLNISSFLGSGAEQAANTEAHQVQTAVVAYMAYTTVTGYSGSVGPTTTSGPGEYLLNPSTLQATYTITNGVITAATPIDNSRWGNCAFSGGSWTCS